MQDRDMGDLEDRTGGRTGGPKKGSSNVDTRGVLGYPGDRPGIGRNRNC